MSKPIKNLIIDEYKKRFNELGGAVLIDIRGMESGINNSLRTQLAEKGMKITVVKNTLLKAAVADTALENVKDVVDGSCAMVYGVDEDVSVVNVARELVDAAKTANFDFCGAVLDGTVFGAKEVDALSKYPTREEAQAKVVQVFLSPGANLAGAAKGPASAIASILKTVQEKLEDGVAITKIS